MADQILKAEDLLADEGFLAFCLDKDYAEKAYWESLIAGDTLQANEIRHAMALLKMIRLDERPVSEEQLAQAHQRYLSSTAQFSNDRGKRRRIPGFIKWAAAAAVLISIGVTWFVIGNGKKVTLQSMYGEIRHEKLPDGTNITMNANSNVSYFRDFNKSGKREVWMEGEVFFDVSATAEKLPFLVHTGKMDIEVTGTRFNVHGRSARIRVFLSEGSITLHQGNTKPVEMKPGEYAELETTGLKKRVMEDSAITAWRDRKFVFDKTRMADVASLLEEIYGKKITFSDNLVAEKTISGILPNDNLEVLLDALKAAYNFSIVSKEDELVIGSQ